MLIAFACGRCLKPAAKNRKEACVAVIRHRLETEQGLHVRIADGEIDGRIVAHMVGVRRLGQQSIILHNLSMEL